MKILNLIKGFFFNETQSPKVTIEKQREGYIQFGNIFLSGKKKSDFFEFIRKLKDYDGDENYSTTLNYVIEKQWENLYPSIIHLDWKESIETFDEYLQDALKKNFNVSGLKFPPRNKYGANATVSSKNVFKDYDKCLINKKLKLCFIDTNSDEYIIVLHRADEYKNVENAVENIGYNCLTADSNKISG